MCYLPKPKAEADNTNRGLDNSQYHAQPHSITANYLLTLRWIIVLVYTTEVMFRVPHRSYFDRFFYTLRKITPPILSIICSRWIYEQIFRVRRTNQSARNTIFTSVIYTKTNYWYKHMHVCNIYCKPMNQFNHVWPIM